MYVMLIIYFWLNKLWYAAVALWAYHIRFWFNCLGIEHLKKYIASVKICATMHG